MYAVNQQCLGAYQPKCVGFHGGLPGRVAQPHPFSAMANCSVGDHRQLLNGLFFFFFFGCVGSSLR